MTLQFHPAVQSDFDHAIAYYEAEGGTHLADRFEVEFRLTLLAIKTGPTRFPLYQGSVFFRRSRLKNFPYILVYRPTPDGIRITLLKHERRHPLYEMQRQ